MPRTFTQLTYIQRCKIKELLDAGISKQAIAEIIGVHHSTIYREINRGTVKGQYNPEYAETQYQAKLAEKGQTAILDEKPELAAYIADKILREKWSPEKIAAALKEDKRFSKTPLSKEAIYDNLDKGRIPGVTRDALRTEFSTIFNDGQIYIPRWVLRKLDWKDGTVLHLEVTEDGKIIYQKAVD